MKRTLKSVLRVLHSTGEYQDFTAEGVPTVASVQKLLGSKVTRTEIDIAWITLFSHSTCRENANEQTKTKA